MRGNANNFLWTWPALVAAVLISSLSHSSTQLIIRDNEGDAGDVIVLPEGAELDVAVNESGITLTFPNVDLRMRCLGEPTEEGYCLLEAGATGGGSGVGYSDTDGDGVPDDIDLCFSTPSGSFVNSNGCPDTGGSNPTPPTDSDNDGQPDGSDNCPNTANASQTDSDGDGVGDACDSTPNGSGGESGGGSGGGSSTPSTSAYCSNAQASNVSCSTNRNLDNWYQGTGDVRYTIASGFILSLPFTTRASSSDTATLVYTTDTGPLPTSQYAWRSWLSQYPAGDLYDADNCYVAGSQARMNMTITQKSGVTGCKIPATKATWYVNYVVSGAAGYYGSSYKFDIQRASQ